MEQTLSVEAARLTGGLIGLARTLYVNEPGPDPWQTLLEGLAALDSGSGLEEQIQRVWQQKWALAPGCAGCAAPCGRTADYDLAGLESAPPLVRGLKELLLRAARSMAVCLLASGQEIREEQKWCIAKALFAVGEDWDEGYLAPVLAEAAGCLVGLPLSGEGQAAAFCRLLAGLGQTGSPALDAMPEELKLSPAEGQALKTAFSLAL